MSTTETHSSCRSGYTDQSKQMVEKKIISMEDSKIKSTEKLSQEAATIFFKDNRISSSLSLKLGNLPDQSQNFNDPASGMSVLQRMEEIRKAQTASKLNKDSQESESSNGPERKESTIWTQPGKINEKYADANNTENGEVGWKPPALTTFSQKRHFPSGEKQQKKDPEALDSLVGLKQTSKATSKSTKDILPPVSEIIVRPPPDDDSTIGTEGTYLERFPKGRKTKKNKRQEEIIVNKIVAVDNSLGSEVGMKIETATKKTGRINGNVNGDLNTNVMESTEMKPNIPIGKGKFESDKHQPTYITRSIEMKPHIPIGNETSESDKQQQLSPQSKLDNDDDNLPSNSFEKSDPPGDAYLHFYNPRNLNRRQPLVGPPESLDDYDYDGHSYANNQYIPLASTHRNESVVTGTSETMRHIPLKINSQPTIRTSWVPPSMNNRRRKVDLNPTRFYINSLMTRKRSTSPIQSTMEDHKLQLKPEDHVRSQIQSRKKSTSSQIDLTGTVDWTRSLSSSSQSSESRDINIVDHSESSNDFDEYRGVSNASQPQVPHDISSYSKGSENSFHSEHEKIGISTNQSKDNIMPQSSEQFLPQLGKPRDMQFQMHEEESYRFGKCASSSSTSSVSKRFSKEIKQPISGRRGIMTKGLLCITAILILILGGAVVIVILWRMGVLFDDSDNNQSVPIIAPTPISSVPVLPSTRAPSAAIVVEDNPTSNALNDISVSPSLSSLSPLQPESDINLFDLIIEAYPQGRPALQDPRSPQGQALKWLESSVNKNVYSEQRFLQRYVLSTVYYSTNGEGWINNTAWLSELDECSWMSKAEFVCDDSGRYIELDLMENNLVGTLPPELKVLSDSLRVINVRKNKLSGELPASTISDLTNLEVLDLSSNSFSGAVLPQLFDATSLTRLSLFENTLSSFIPTELGQLRELNVLDLGSNRLTSSIPSTIDRLSELVGLSVFDNMLSGTVPTELANLQSLEMLYIDSNNFEAPLPTDICLLNLEEFWSDCEAIQCRCCTKCCSNDFGCFAV